MVLDDASAQADGFRNDNTSSDPFTHPIDPNNPFSKYYPLRVRQDLIYKPGLLGTYLVFFGKRNWERKFTEDVLSKIEHTKLLVQRYPTQEELDAYVEQSSRGGYYARLGLPLGFAAGVVHSLNQIRTAPDFPRSNFNPVQIMEYIRMHARADPSSFRGAAFMAGFKLFVWSITGVTLSSIYASYQAMRMTMTDPRFERLRKEVNQQKPEDIQKRKVERANERYQQFQKAKEKLKHGAVAESHEHDSYGESNGASDTYYGTADTGETTTTPSQPVSSEPDRDNRRVYGNSGTTGGSSDSDFFNDDANPTNPAQRNDDGSINTSGGSTWDRIRQQNTSGTPDSRRQGYRAPQQPNQPSDQQNGYDSYSSEERDRQRDREQAQRDFDRMVDAERKSGDDSSGTGGQNRGWGGGWNR